jgi:hypothetical protein
MSIVYERLFDVEPQAFAIVRGELAPHKSELTGKLWAVLADERGDPERRFRAACGLAGYVPDDARWVKYGPFVVEKLVTADALALRDWKNALDLAGRRLLPALSTAIERGDWEAAQRRKLIELYASFCGGKEDAFAWLENKLSARNAHGRNTAELAKGNANVAAALVALHRGTKVWPLLVHSKDPTLRSYLIERCGSSGLDPKVLEERLKSEKDVSARGAIILAFGGFPPDRLAGSVPVLVHLYENDSDPGIHAAAGWVLRQWGQGRRLANIDKNLATGRVEGDRHWYLSKQGQTFAIISGPGGLLQRVQAGVKPQAHRFAIAATEVTVGQFLAFERNHKIDKSVARTVDSPVNMVSWYAATEYCNWLSQQEGIPKDQWCYRIDKNGMLDFVPDYQSRTGYRLPTEAEWEFACRAGAQTLLSFGSADQELLGKYAWWIGNAHADGERRCFPVGLLKPNDFGLFDMHGNVAELCQEPTTPVRLINDVACGGRGGCYFSPGRGIACDRNFVVGRTMEQAHIGFRPVRSLK